MSDENRVNIPLLRKAVEWAEAEALKPPELREWEQSRWHLPATPEEAAACGENWEYVQRVRDKLDKADECGSCYCIAGYVTVCDGGDQRQPWFAAKDALGLEQDAADRLFEAENTAADVRRIAEEIAGESL